MLSKEELQNDAGKTIYLRGAAIYAGAAVTEYQSHRSGRMEYARARVQGSGTLVYRVGVTYDWSREAIDSYSCQCAAFVNYDGMCKHCVALALRYIQDCEERGEEDSARDGENLDFDGALQQLLGLGGAFGSTVSRGGSHRTDSQRMRTSPELKLFLDRQTERRMLPITQGELSGRVALEPLLTYSGFGWSVQFKIGIPPKRLYVVQDVWKLADAILRGAEYSLGSKTVFVPTPETFLPEQRALARFLCSLWECQEDRESDCFFYGEYNRSGNRDIRLEAFRVVELLEALEGQDVLIRKRDLIRGDGGAGERWRILRGKGNYPLKISGEQDGIRLRIERMEEIWGERNCAFLRDGAVYLTDRAEAEPVRDFLQCFARAGSSTLCIQRSDVPAFCRGKLAELEAFFVCAFENFDPAEYGAWQSVIRMYLDAPQRDRITCRAKVFYGEKEYNLFRKNSADFERDFPLELGVERVIMTYFPTLEEGDEVRVLERDEERMYELLTGGIPQLQKLGEVFVTDALRGIRVHRPANMSVGISLSGELLELTLGAGNLSPEQLREILGKYDRKKKYYRLKSGEFIDMEDAGVEALLELKDGLGLSASELGKEKICIPRYRAIYLDAQLKESQALSAEADSDFKRLVSRMEPAGEEDFAIPPSVADTLREYQRRGFQWMKRLQRGGFGGILADEMGLGKTLQIIALLLAEEKKWESGVDVDGGGRRPALIVCPTSLVYNWQSEFQRFAPELRTRLIAGTAPEREELLSLVQPGEILITSYDLLKRDLEKYRELSFSCMVIDEAQYIKNHNTQAALAVKQIRALFRMALTGTPIENRLSELWSIFDFLMPGFLYSYHRFREQFEAPIVQGEDAQVRERLQKLIRPFVLRRLKKDVLADLPDKLEENLFVGLQGAQKELYEAHVQRMIASLESKSNQEFCRNKLSILAELTKLRQLCCDPALYYADYQGESAKLDMLVELVKNAVDGGHKILLFSQFVEMLKIIAEKFRREGISFFLLEGKTSREERRDMVERFQEDQTSVFCISLRAGGTGLNLTAADIVIHFDPWWNLAVQNQATDRAHRIGQENVVNVYRLIAKDTIEERIVRLQERKRELADALLGGGELDGAEIGREELLALLRA